MKFFTPELFIDLNSEDDPTVDRAEVKWVKAVRGYRQHLKRIERRLPKSLKRFSDDYCLHDGVVLSPSEQSEDFLPLLMLAPAQSNSTSAVVRVRLKDALLVLGYFGTTARPSIEKPIDSPVFYGDQVIWLYDEIDSIGDHEFSHEILFSNGNVARICFHDFLIVEQLDFRSSIGSDRRKTRKARLKAS